VANVPPLSVCIITYNEEANLPRCVASVGFADEIVVVDSGSTDRTVALAVEAGCRVIEQPFLGYAAQKNLAAQAASHPWVLCLDADEWLLPGAAAIIRDALATRHPHVAGYALNRHTYYLGDWVNHGGWWPEYRLRLYDRQRGQWVDDGLHEGVKVRGAVSRLDVEVGHLSYRDIAHHFTKLNTYTSIRAEHWHAQNHVSVGWLQFIGHPLWRFCRMFVFKGGWREGYRGLIIASIGAFYVFTKYAKLWELQHGCGRDQGDEAVSATRTKNGNAMTK
jgi:glycosyltransferase involved in cell wall biosynthesis